MGEIKCPHCDTSVDEHEAGRKTDVCVAVVVMGIVVPDWGPDTPCPINGSEMRWTEERAWCYDHSEWHYGPAQEYSTDIAAAWEVVGRMGDVLRRLLRNKGSEKWECIFDYVHVGTAPTAPLAICRAALKAVGE